MAVEIESIDVVRLIEQYLKENNFLLTLERHQKKSNISLNTIDLVDTFKQDKTQAHWDTVLKVIKNINLPEKKLVDLYEQIVIELMCRSISCATYTVRAKSGKNQAWWQNQKMNILYIVLLIGVGVIIYFTVFA